jgi:hypothetical protein
MSTPFPTTIAGKLELAGKIKDEGNELFKQQNYKKAIMYVVFYPVVCLSILLYSVDLS